MAKRTKEKPKPAAKSGGDEEVLGKAYDSRLMRRLLTYMRPYTGHAVLSFAAILLKAAADVAGPYLILVATDRYMTGRSTTFVPPFLQRHLSTVPLTGITQCALLYMCALLMSYGLEFLQTYLMQWTGQRIMFDMRSQIFRHLQRMHVGFYDKNPVGRLVTRVTSDIDALNEMFTSGVLAIFEDVFVLIFIVGIMLWMSWPLALLTLSVLPLIMYATRLFRIAVRASYRRIRVAIAKINAYTQEHVSGMSVVQLFNREERAYKDFQSINAEHRDAFVDQVQAYSLYYPAVELLSSIAIATVIWKGGLGVLHGSTFFGRTVTVGVLLAFMQYAQRFFRPIMDLSEKYNILQAAMAASERVFKLIDTEPEIVSPATVTATPDSGSPCAIEFRDVWFTYQTLNDDQRVWVETAADAELAASTDIEWILRGVSFRVARGETAAIVGHTGAGKTTITALMMRFYDVTRGAVLIDGVDVREVALDTLRRRFGVVLQDAFLFTGTVRSNIRLGSEWITDAEVEHAADEVNIGDFIRTLPQGFDQPMQERGATLSTGQKQLISFARALAHRPEILILDEATSSVDTDTELRVRLALQRMITGRTSVVIAHRLSTIQRADTILVMHKGQLRESGTHNELLVERGLYWRLYRLQYKDQEDTVIPIPAEPLRLQPGD
ncbi:ABC-type multidrug transport system, ATPase and permease component [Terriglobus roseus DSM 18391]|uniref:ABC-type multidrug transport system, ATPase and permease component n=1 Tax=Terriglobus roseus (strain DSM 18391 / NRRL B-41598 / KBS 63) TaxID=926566 RepID=I3ZI43_TERRK|nr:ABC transporter ATP-binding protein [Terriglobus roseus]AFL88570.1 ABC-type multidrug transport system, ATPase and permease component [Terriglobus roseus DSM 18391]AFL88911.1 ABC-type multidrug transport system, ATPase and permease component [Terriglobus roseus DSM 18391]